MKRIAIAAVSALALSGCAGMGETQQRTLTGGAIGAAGGTIIGALTGSPVLGGLLGAGVGSGAGYLIGRGKENERGAYEAGYQHSRQEEAQFLRAGGPWQQRQGPVAW